MPTHKYFAKPTNVDGIRFSSKLEASYYSKLKMLRNAGEIVFFLRQVPFDLPGCKYLADFQIFWRSGDVSFIDVKGIDTPVSKLKRKQVEDLYPVKIQVVEKGDF